MWPEQPITNKQKQEVEAAVKLTVEKYGDTLKRLEQDEQPIKQPDTKDFTELDKETRRILMALANMYSQYCDKPFGHDFMGAGESAIEVLEDYGLASEAIGVNDEKMNELEGLL